MLNAEWLTAIASAGTFVVIAASAVAALMQLRHMRSSNQIFPLTELREQMESPEFLDAREWVRHELPKLLDDPDVMERIRRAELTGDLRKIVYVANLFEWMGSFVRFNIIDRKIACELISYVVVQMWDGLLPVIRAVRSSTDGIWENFEFLAAISFDFIEKHPESYPPGVRRLSMDVPLSKQE